MDMDMDYTFPLIVLLSNGRRLIITTWPFVEFGDQGYDYREDVILKRIANDIIGTKKLLILFKICGVEMILFHENKVLFLLQILPIAKSKILRLLRKIV